MHFAIGFTNEHNTQSSSLVVDSVTDFSADVPEIWLDGAMVFDEFTEVTDDELDEDAVTVDVVEDEEDEEFDETVDECSMSSFHRDSKNFRSVCPPRPTSDSSSLKVLQFSKISLQSAANSALDLYTESRSLFLIVLKSMGCLIYLRYVGNCLKFTGFRNGQPSSCFSISVRTNLHKVISSDCSAAFFFSFSLLFLFFSDDGVSTCFVDTSLSRLCTGVVFPTSHFFGLLGLFRVRFRPFIFDEHAGHTHFLGIRGRGGSRQSRWMARGQ